MKPTHPGGLALFALGLATGILFVFLLQLDDLAHHAGTKPSDDATASAPLAPRVRELAALATLEHERGNNQAAHLLALEAHGLQRAENIVSLEVETALRRIVSAPGGVPLPLKVSSVAVHPDGDWVTIVDDERVFRSGSLSDLLSGTPLRTLETGGASDWYFYPPSKTRRLLTFSRGGPVRLWDLGTRRAPREIASKAQALSVERTRRYFGFVAQGKAYLWDLGCEPPTSTAFPMDDFGTVVSSHLTEGGLRFALSNGEGRLRVYGKEQAAPLLDTILDVQPGTDLTASRGGNWLSFIQKHNSPNRARRRRARSRRVIPKSLLQVNPLSDPPRILSLQVDDRPAHLIETSWKDRWVAVRTHDHRLQVWNLRAKKPRDHAQVLHEAWPERNNVFFSKDDCWMWGHAEGQELHVWRCDSEGQFQLVFKQRTPTPPTYHQVQVSPDGRFVQIVDHDLLSWRITNKVRALDERDATVIRVAGHEVHQSWLDSRTGALLLQTNRGRLALANLRLKVKPRLLPEETSFALSSFDLTPWLAPGIFVTLHRGHPAALWNLNDPPQDPILVRATQPMFIATTPRHHWLWCQDSAGNVLLWECDIENRIFKGHAVWRTRLDQTGMNAYDHGLLFQGPGGGLWFEHLMPKRRRKVHLGDPGDLLGWLEARQNALYAVVSKPSQPYELLDYTADAKKPRRIPWPTSVSVPHNASLFASAKGLLVVVLPSQDLTVLDLGNPSRPKERLRMLLNEQVHNVVFSPDEGYFRGT